MKVALQVAVRRRDIEERQVSKRREMACVDQALLAFKDQIEM